MAIKFAIFLEKQIDRFGNKRGLGLIMVDRELGKCLGRQGPPSG